MGAPWSKTMIGRVMVGGTKRWVAFIGGGVYAPDAADSGKGFFVIDLVDGSVLWSYTKADNADLDNPMPAPPAIVDTDNDGFIDTVYLGDLGSNMWRFKFCRAADGGFLQHGELVGRASVRGERVRREFARSTRPRPWPRIKTESLDLLGNRRQDGPHEPERTGEVLSR